ncbi:phosphotransferase [Actinoplanes sp. Pm04-4]|uniref:Phosphotransferase n=1 Tax=Paractinoplanes pyxinae TaxID=2997416 RepID=A0ABT4B6J9_9ACTN|nr:phosphotransferase [Actinoplanes pyxinae]MCY1141475.1 phosphotransferase [Actinoplanes pyxinae]
MTSWSSALLEQLATKLCRAAGLPAPHQRTTIREWELCGVHRLHLPDRTLILKLALPPFTNEPVTLTALAAAGIPVPALHAYTQHADVTGMLMADLGPALHAPTYEQTAGAAAAHLHRPDPLPGHPTVDTAALHDTAVQGLALVDQAHAVGAIANPGPLHAALKHLDQFAALRARDTDRPPYGICHGELHPTALHISTIGQHFVDVPLAHTGPGLLDLASVLGVRAVDVNAMRTLISSYVRTGGHPDAGADRGGLDSARWALGWHRVLSALRHLRQAGADQPVDGVGHLSPSPPPNDDVGAAERQLRAAIQLLE